MVRLAMSLAWICLASTLVAAEPADLVVWHGQLLTIDPQQPTAQALAIRQGQIIAVGSDVQIQAYITPHTKVIDAAGRLVVPGFNDAHVHFMAGGRQLSSVQLRDAATPEEFVRRIAQFAQTLPPGQWITGGDWDHENWASGQLPTRQWIDAVTADHPVLVRRLDGHMALANSLALKLAGITRQTPDPAGGLIVRDAQGEPTGVLKDAAMSPVFAVQPAFSLEQRRSAALAATEHAASLGVTSVQDMSGEEDVMIYQQLRREGKLKTRIYAAAPLPAWQKSAQLGLKAATGDAWIRRGGLKGFADGSLGSTTAYFFQPYDDDPRTTGLASDEMVPEGAMFERIQGADRAGLQMMIHAIGDRANAEILDLYAQLITHNGPRDRRMRIEHAQHLRSEDIPRFAQLGVIASMQPFHCADDGRWAEKRIGRARAGGTYAFRSLLDSGAILAFGSDWNVATLDPIAGIAAAVTRQTLDGKHPQGWVPEQKITVAEAIHAYTLGSATAEFSETTKGSLSVGKLADLVILSHDLLAMDVNKINECQVVLTIVDGQIVYEQK